MRRACLLLCGLLACAQDNAVILRDDVEDSPPPGVYEAPVAPPPGYVEPIGDPGADEHEILAVRDKISDEELLGLPGSQGFAIMSNGGAAISYGAGSVGTPDAGTLSGGVQLPFDPDSYTRRDATRSYATSQTIETIRAAMKTLRMDRHVDAEVIIGDISLPRGGRFAPHVSHTSGRDIDIRLILAAGLDRKTLPFAAEQVDWDATWALVHSFLETGHVTYVFLEYAHQGELMSAAKRAGVHTEVLARWFQWPDAFDATSIIRHEPGHRAHLHVRLGCGGQGARCQGQ